MADHIQMRESLPFLKKRLESLKGEYEMLMAPSGHEWLPDLELYNETMETLPKEIEALETKIRGYEHEISKPIVIDFLE
jgi:hypothetical protein